MLSQEKSVLDCELGKRADFLEDNENFAFFGAPENVGFLQMIAKMLPLVGYSVAECVEFLEIVRFRFCLSCLGLVKIAVLT